MKETSLASTIDSLAKRKAEDFITQVKTAIQTALKDKYRDKVAGGSAFLGEDIKNVVEAYAASIGRSDSYKTPQPTSDLINLCRATIVDDLLNGLPKIVELSRMLDTGDTQ